MSETTLLSSQGKLTREQLALVPTLLGTTTHRPIPHAEVVNALVDTLGLRKISVAAEEYAVSKDGMNMFGVMEIDQGMEDALLIADSDNYRVRKVPGVAAALAVTVSAASGTAPVAPGSIVSIYGSNLATTGTSATTLPLPTNLGGTSVSIADSSGAKASLPLFYAGPNQINAEIPQTASAGAATLTITTPSGTQIASVMLATVAPGLFTANQSKGVAAAQFANGQQPVIDIFNCAAGRCAGVPLDVSSGNTALVLYGTGIQNRASLSDVTVKIGSQTLPAAYAGSAGFIGEDQVNVLLPDVVGCD